MSAEIPQREALLLRLEAPLMSFGGVAVDETRRTLEHPGRAMLTGLLANALGWLRSDFDALQSLQERLDFAVRRDRQGSLLNDFHTVDLGQDFMKQGWTTRGATEGRNTSDASKGTHIRHRHFLADAAYTVAIGVDPPDESPTLDELERALWRPARPLFLGRKTCLPARPLVDDPTSGSNRVRADSLVEALTDVPSWADRSETDSPSLWWFQTTIPKDHPAIRHDRQFPITDDRVWSIQKHTGRRFMEEGALRSSSVEPTNSEDPEHV